MIRTACGERGLMSHLNGEGFLDQIQLSSAEERWAVLT